MPFADDIKSFALALGFHKVGIARATPLNDETSRLREWLARGYYGTMEWMNRNVEKRNDVRLILPGAASVISVAMNYQTPFVHSNDEQAGKISRYAWGDDYHDILTPKLHLLLEWMKSQKTGLNGKVYVDTGPVMDKVWAAKAGIGWEGKHTNIISHEFGSWIFLGELIVDIELEYDEPAIDRCGTCTLCIDACPTQAIVEPYVLDATKCISYLTIEHKGEIDDSLTKNFDGWLYGCDVCQDVCPWNHKFSEPTDVREFLPRENNIQPALQEIEQLTEEEFKKKFKGSPIKRTKIEGLKRNGKVLKK